MSEIQQLINIAKDLHKFLAGKNNDIKTRGYFALAFILSMISNIAHDKAEYYETLSDMCWENTKESEDCDA